MLAAVSAPPATPRPSSTVIVLGEARDAEGPFSVLLLERHGSIAFPGATAFPGGVVEAGRGGARSAAPRRAALGAAGRGRPPARGARLLGRGVARAVRGDGHPPRRLRRPPPRGPARARPGGPPGPRGGRRALRGRARLRRP